MGRFKKQPNAPKTGSQKRKSRGDINPLEESVVKSSLIYTLKTILRKETFNLIKVLSEAVLKGEELEEKERERAIKAAEELLGDKHVKELAEKVWEVIIIGGDTFYEHVRDNIVKRLIERGLKPWVYKSIVTHVVPIKKTIKYEYYLELLGMTFCKEGVKLALEEVLSNQSSSGKETG